MPILFTHPLHPHPHPNCVGIVLYCREDEEERQKGNKNRLDEKIQTRRKERKVERIMYSHLRCHIKERSTGTADLVIISELIHAKSEVTEPNVARCVQQNIVHFQISATKEQACIQEGRESIPGGRARKLTRNKQKRAIGARTAPGIRLATIDVDNISSLSNCSGLIRRERSFFSLFLFSIELS